MRNGAEEKDPWERFIDRLYDYWSYYGGTKQITKTVYLYLALGFFVISFPAWSNPGWWETTISISTMLVGFSITGYALVLAIGNERYQKLMMKRPGGKGAPPYLLLSAAFTHYIIVSFISLLLSLLAKSYYQPDWQIYELAFSSEKPLYHIQALPILFWALCYFFFSYSLFCGLEAILYIFVVTKTRQKASETTPKKKT